MKSFILSLLTAIVLTACSNYGQKVSKDYLDVYYKDGITKEQAQKALDYFLPKWKDEGEKTKPKSIQLTKNGDTINFRMVANMEVMSKMDEQVFYVTGNELSTELFNGSPVNVILTNDKFETIRSYSYKKMEVPDFGEKINSGMIEVYIKGGFSREQATTLAKFLEQSINPAETISFQISTDEKGYYLLRMVANPEKITTLSDTQLEEMAQAVSENVFTGSPVIFQLTNSIFEPIKTVEYKKNAADSSSIQ